MSTETQLRMEIELLKNRVRGLMSENNDIRARNGLLHLYLKITHNFLKDNEVPAAKGFIEGVINK